MKKMLSLTLCLAVLLACLSSCSGYNKIMRDHLSDADNYHTFNVTLHSISYQDPSTYDIVYDFDPSEVLDYDIIFRVTFETREEVSAFWGGRLNPDIPLEECIVPLQVISDNHKVLVSNGFYDHVSLGDTISITASDWIYMDGDFFFVAQAEYDGTEYLNLEDGLKNIISMMNKNKSLF